MLNKQYYIWDNIDKCCVQNRINGSVITDIRQAEKLLLRYQLSVNNWDRYMIRVKQAAK